MIGGIKGREPVAITNCRPWITRSSTCTPEGFATITPEAFRIIVYLDAVSDRLHMIGDLTQIHLRIAGRQPECGSTAHE